MVACRPDDVRLEPLSPRAANRLPVVVEEAVFLGESVEYRVRTSGGRELLVYGSRREPHAVGASLDLVIDPANATAWPR